MPSDSPTVRLSPTQVAVIKQSFVEVFGRQDKLWLFGSRVDLSKKGGDIDFYIETKESNISSALQKKLDFVNKLWTKLGEQKIDVVLNILALEYELPIYELAKTEGVKLQ